MILLKDKKNDGDPNEYAGYLKFRSELLDDKSLPREARTLLDVIDLKYLYLIKDYKNLLDRLAKYPRNSIFLAEPKLLGFKIYYPDHLWQVENITLNDLTKKIKEISRLVKSINDSTISFDELENIFSYKVKVNELERTYHETIFSKYGFIFSQSIAMFEAYYGCDYVGEAVPLIRTDIQFSKEYNLALKLFIEKIGDDENKLIRVLNLNFFDTTDNKPENLKELFKKFAIKNIDKPSKGIRFNNLLAKTEKMTPLETIGILCKMKEEPTNRYNACYGDSFKNYEGFINEIKMDTAYFDDIANNFYSTSSVMGKFVFSALYNVEFTTTYAVFKLSSQELKFIGIYQVSHSAGCD